MKLYGLIGYPLEHSFSSKFFNKKFSEEKIDSLYINYPLISLDKFEEFLETPDLVGLNVTIPYKRDVIPFLDSMDEEAKAIGAVNVIKIYEEFGIRKTKGFNSDLYGFRESIRPFIEKLKNILKENVSNSYELKALVLGTGGVSKAISYGLEQLGIKVKFVSRTKKENTISYDSLSKEIINDYRIIVNATPLGMYPKIDKCPDIPYEYLSEGYLLFDAVYNPEKSLFLSKGAEKGALIKNGLEMLHLQALRAYEIWNG